MAQVTVNYLLAMEKSLRERLNQLNDLKSSVSKRAYWEDKDKVEEPTYDVKAVDKKITAINKALFALNHKVKESNAKTLVDIKNLDYDSLVSEID